jgi:GTP-binding protein HflX
MTQVDAVLADIGAQAIPQIVVYNKIDRLELAPRIDRDADGRVTAVWISAAQNAGLAALEQAITERLSRATRRARLRIPASGGALRSRLYAAHVVREELPSEDGSIELTVELPMLELLSLARTSGVRILEVADDELACVPAEGFLQSAPFSGVTRLR